MKAYKFLAEGARGRFSDAQWPLPAAGDPGAWISAGGPLEECRRGVHACTAEQLLDWLDDELWEVELVGSLRTGDAAVVAARGRLLARVDAWRPSLACAFAARCLDRVRQHAVRALEGAGDAQASDTLARARTLADVNAVAARAEGTTAELVGFVADCMLLATGARPEEIDAAPHAAAPTAAAIAANLGFVCAHVAGRAAGDGYDAAFAAERADQLAWLRAELDL